MGALPLQVSPLLGGADPAVTDGFWFRSPSEEGVDGRRRRHITSVLLSCGSRGFYLGQHSSGGFEGATLKWLLPCGWRLLSGWRRGLGRGNVQWPVRIVGSHAQGQCQGRRLRPGAGDGSALGFDGPHVLRVVDVDPRRPGHRGPLPLGQAHPPGIHVGSGRVVGGLQHGRQGHVQGRRQVRRDFQVVGRLLVDDGKGEAGLAVGKERRRGPVPSRRDVDRSGDAGDRCVQQRGRRLAEVAAVDGQGNLVSGVGDALGRDDAGDLARRPLQGGQLQIAQPAVGPGQGIGDRGFDSSSGTPPRSGPGSPPRRR